MTTVAEEEYVVGERIRYEESQLLLCLKGGLEK